MKISHLGCAIAALSLFPGLAARAAYDPAIVAADARWVVFADLNSLRSSSVGKELVSAMEKAQASATGGVIGIDIPKVLATVGSLTAYGTNLSKDPNAIDGALIAQGTADLRKIAESLLLQATLAEPRVFSEVTDLDFPAYSIADPKGGADAKMQVIIAFPPEPIVLVSKSKAQLLKARDVYRGAAPSLLKGGTPALRQLSPQAGTAYLFAASVVPTESLFPQNAPQARILQLAGSGSVALGERGPDTFARIELLASSDQNAEKLMKILQGMAAVFSLAESNDRQLSEFLNATSVTREKQTVILHLAYASSRLVEMAQALQAQVEARPVNRQPPMVQGKTVDEWVANEASAPEGEGPAALNWRTIEKVSLVTSDTITLGRVLNGGKTARFDRVEIAPADGSSAPLVFRSEHMRNARGTMSQFQFPGADGVYTLKVAYVNDPDGKAKYAVSVGAPKPTEGKTMRVPGNR